MDLLDDTIKIQDFQVVYNKEDVKEEDPEIEITEEDIDNAIEKVVQKSAYNSNVLFTTQRDEIYYINEPESTENHKFLISGILLIGDFRHLILCTRKNKNNKYYLEKLLIRDYSRPFWEYPKKVEKVMYNTNGILDNEFLPFLKLKKYKVVNSPYFIC